MKAVLEFDLTDTEDRMAHQRCVKATEMAIALFDIIFNLRNRVERNLEGTIDENTHIVLNAVCEQITEYTENIDIENLIN